MVARTWRAPFTLRAALDVLPAKAKVRVAELNAVVVE